MRINDGEIRAYPLRIPARRFWSKLMKITEEMIRNKAFELWKANGKPAGTAETDWFAAQALLRDAARVTTSARNQPPPNGLRQLNTA
jgi:hypothetical protein